MIAWIGAIFIVLGFLVLCRQFGLVARTREVFARVHESFVTLGDKTLDDDQKERALQAGALRLFKLFGILSVGGAAALLVPLGVLWSGDRLGLVPLEPILATAVSWEFLGVTTLAALLTYPWWRQHPVPAAANRFENHYSKADRLLHDIAFSTGPVQLAIARIEDRLSRARLARVSAAAPVFITALPRAGTTLLLELCANQDEFVTHTYRQMPFVITPLWWEKLSRRFRVQQAARERAHRDGMLFSLDSPEALEEALWLEYWKDHYLPDRIQPWAETEQSPAFLAFFRNHICKLALVYDADRTQRHTRYVSKNNLNISRVRWLLRALPDAKVVIPYRSPLQHAASLLRQHKNFSRIHASDPFARRYMAAIGHFDFGANLRPIDFDGWLDRTEPAHSGTLDFWLQYWTACYNQLSAISDPRVLFVSFESLCAEPARGLAEIADFLGIENRSGFVAQAQRIHLNRPRALDLRMIDAATLAEADAVHKLLQARSFSPARVRVSKASPVHASGLRPVPGRRGACST